MKQLQAETHSETANYLDRYLWGDGGWEAVYVVHACVCISMNMLQSSSTSVPTQGDTGEEKNLNNSNPS